MYGDGQNVRDWLSVEDHVDALLLAACRGELGRSTCVGGSGSTGTASERNNKQVVEAICSALDVLQPAGAPHSQLITLVSDRPGHDRRYAIDPTRISTELGWQPRHSFQEGLPATLAWYLEQQAWCRRVRDQGGYGGDRLGVLSGNPSRAGMALAPRKTRLQTEASFGAAFVATRLTTAAGVQAGVGAGGVDALARKRCDGFSRAAVFPGGWLPG